MQLFPAIDMKDGQVVRLYKGDYDRVTVFADNPQRVANEFLRKGAKNLHIVDLDGARDGTPKNSGAICNLVKTCGLFTEVGGGIRDEARVAELVEMGVGRAILGTVAVTNFDFVAEMAKKYGEHIAVGVDAKDGFVAIHGWTKTSDIDATSFCAKLRDANVKTVIFTDIARDGALLGSNLAIYEELSKIEGLNVIASGGISGYDEIRTLSRMGIYGAVIGKAIYTKKLDLAKLIAIAAGEKA